MKKSIISILAVLVFSLTLLSCDDIGPPRVRVKNSTGDILTNVKAGEAEFDEIAIGDRTKYKKAKEGSHKVYWTRTGTNYVTTGTIGPLEEGEDYTFTINSSNVVSAVKD